MKLPRSTSLFRSIKLAPLALFGFFVFSNVTGILFSRALAPLAHASSPDDIAIPSDIPSSGDKRLDRIIFRVGEHEGIDPRFIHAVIWQESKYDVTARSHAGAQGLMQLMPDTAKRFGCAHPDDPEDNVEAGTKYLSWLLKRFSGNVQLALAGYNAGEGNVDKYNGIPPFDETKNYVRIISERYGKTYHPVLPPEQAIDAFHLRENAESDSTAATQ